MDNLTLAQKLLGKEKTTEASSETVNPSSASIVYMVAVTSSSNGEVVLKDEVEAADDWENEDIIEIDEDGDFDEFESDEDPLEDIDDTVVDLTDGDGADIEDPEGEVVSFSVTDYHEAAVAALEEAEAVGDELPDEDAEIDDAIDDGDAEVIPDVGEDNEDELPDEDAEVEDMTDDEYTPTDDNSDDESEDPIEGAEISDGYTIAECIGSIKAGDRVAVIIQDGKPTVLGVVGSGDEQEALTRQASEAADEASAAAESAEAKAAQAQQAVEEAVQKAEEAKAKADLVETNMAGITAEVDSVKEDAVKMRSDLEGQIETAKSEMSATFATKDDISTSETTLRQEMQTSIAGIQSTFAQDYAKKTDVDNAIIEAKASLQTQITQNADSIASTAKSVEEIQVDITEQDGKITAAQNAATEAQSIANASKTAADEAQALANSAKSDLATAQEKLAEVEASADANAEDIAQAQQAVADAQTAADNAQTAANTAKIAADEAQKAADEAKEDLSALESRVTTAETAIQQNSEAITLRATKTEVAENHYTKTETDAKIKVTSDAIATEVSRVDALGTRMTTVEQTASDLTVRFDTLEIGGKNLLLGTAIQDITKGNYQNNVESTEETLFGCIVFRSSVAWADIGFALTRVIKDNNLKVGDVLTYSIWHKTDDAVARNLHCYTTGAGATGSRKLKDMPNVLNNEWTRLECTFEIDQIMIDNLDSSEQGFRFECESENTSGTYQYWAAPKLERGNKATDWTPAPEDVDSDIADAQAVADAAVLSAFEANTAATNAAKTATNYVNISGTGVVVGNLTADTLGSNVLIDTDSVDIRVGETVLASYQANRVELGVNSEDAIIRLCNGMGQIRVYDTTFYETTVKALRVETHGAVSVSGAKSAELTSKHSEYDSITQKTASYKAHIGIENGEFIYLTSAVCDDYDTVSQVGVWQSSELTMSRNSIAGVSGSISFYATDYIRASASNGVLIDAGNDAGINFLPSEKVDAVPALHMDSSGNIGVGKGLQVTEQNLWLYGNNININPTTAVYFKINGTNAMRMIYDSSENLFFLRPETNGGATLGTSANPFNGVNANILRTYDTTTTSNGVAARIYNNRIYRYSSSSERYKENIQPITAEELNPARLYDAEVVEFSYKDGYLMEGDIREGKLISGFIVEDLEKVYPIAIDYNDDGQPEMWNANIIIPSMLKLIQDQKKQIDGLKKLVEQLLPI